MFAVVKTGGKQYKVAPQTKLQIERLAAEPGETVEFDEVLMLGGDEVVVGTPRIDGAVVRGEVLEQIRGPKVISFVKRRRKHSSQRRRGHRQYLTVVRITDILRDGQTMASAVAEAEPARVQTDAVATEAASPVEASAPVEPAVETAES